MKLVIPNPVRLLNGVRNLLFLFPNAKSRSLTRDKRGFGMTTRAVVRDL